MGVMHVAVVAPAVPVTRYVTRNEVGHGLAEHDRKIDRRNPCRIYLTIR